jgi:hypothetical protein
LLALLAQTDLILEIVVDAIEYIEGRDGLGFLEGPLS